jgi:hypothetical protein
MPRKVESSTHAIWRGMLSRCQNAKAKDYGRYGGRGITVCDRWKTFALFLADMGERPAGMTLERKDGAKGYSPENCTWATYTQQARNRRGNVHVTHEGSTATIAEWAERTGLERKTLQYRIRAGWPAERALTTPSLINRKQHHV